MARTPLLNQVEDAMGSIAAEEAGVTRREIVKRAAVAGVGLTAARTVRAARSRGDGAAGRDRGRRARRPDGRSPAQAGRDQRDGLRGVVAARRPLLHGPRGLRRRADLRARRRADRQRPHRDEAARAGARPRPRQPRAGRSRRNRAAGPLRRTSVQRRRDDSRPEDDLATAPQGHPRPRAIRPRI